MSSQKKIEALLKRNTWAILPEGDKELSTQLKLHRKSLKFFGNCENIAIEVRQRKGEDLLIKRHEVYVLVLLHKIASPLCVPSKKCFFPLSYVTIFLAPFYEWKKSLLSNILVVLWRFLMLSSMKFLSFIVQFSAPDIKATLKGRTTFADKWWTQRGKKKCTWS